MSANKKATVQFNRREYQRLRQLEKSAIFSEDRTRNQHAGAIEHQMQDQLSQLERRQEEYQHLVSGLSNEIQSIEQDAGEALMVQQQAYLSQINTLESHLLTETQQVLEEERAMFLYHIDELEATYQAQFSQVEEELRFLQQTQQEKMQMAMALLEKQEALFSWMIEAYDWKKFLPDELTEVEDKLHLVNRNLDFGNYEVVISNTLQIERILNRCRLTLEALETEWGLLCETVKQHAIRLNLAAKDHRSVHPIDTDGNILSQQKISVNHWSNGKLNGFTQKTKQTYDELLQHGTEFSIEELNNWLETELPALENELVDIVMMARMNVLDSQLRKNIADVIIKTLSDQGFSVQAIDAARDEIDHPIQVDLVNTSGDLVYVYIQPDEEEYAQNTIAIQTDESQPMMAYELENRRHQIAERLREKGVAVEVITEDQPYAYNVEKNTTIEHSTARRQQPLRIKKIGKAA